MKKIIEKIISHPIITLLVIVATIFPFLQSIFKWEIVTKIFNWIYNFIKNVLTYKVEIWIIFLILFLLIGLLYLYLKFIENNNYKPDYLQITQKQVKDILWKWDYKKNYNGIYEIDNLYPICSSCKLQLLRLSHSSDYKCPNCDKITNIWNYGEKVTGARIIIEDEIINGNIDKL